MPPRVNIQKTPKREEKKSPEISFNADISSICDPDKPLGTTL